MKTIKSLAIIITLALTSLNINAQNVQKTEFDTLYDLILAPLVDQNSNQLQTMVKVLTLATKNIEVKNNQLQTSLKKSDFKKAGLSTTTYRIFRKGIKEFNSYVAKNNIQDVEKLLNKIKSKAPIIQFK